MKALRKPAALAVLTLATLLAQPGCASYQGEYPMLSSRPLDLTNFDLDKARNDSRHVEGASEREIYFLLPDRDSFPTLREAIDRALEEGGGDLILDARIHRWHWYIPLMYGSSGWKVTGHVVNTHAALAGARDSRG